MVLDRRALLAGMGTTGLVTLAGRAKATPAPDADDALRHALAALERKAGGKFGASVLDCRDGALVGYRLGERFTMCSTFKLPLAALVLSRIDAGAMAPDATLPISAADPVGHAPVVRARLAAGDTSMAVLDLCEAAQTQSDNGAANILLRALGGPAALTGFFRTLGDGVTRLDRYEPALNTSHDGDPRDTTTAGAMAQNLRTILTGELLTPASRMRLIDWTIATQTGLKRLRGGLPADWRAGDKTGTAASDGSYASKANDVAICWHPHRAEPFIITAFYETAARSKDGPQPADDAVIAQIGRIAGQWIDRRL